MTRATATLLFTDLVGSTELRSRLGETPAEKLRRTHDRLLIRAVEAHGGRVVKGLGDGIMATFSGASEALDAAVAMQQAVDRLNRSDKAPAPLAVRISLSAGDVTVEGDDLHGTPVIEAARLCAAANGGEILVSEVVRLLAGATEPHDLRQRGPLELKGFPGPIFAWEVHWEPAAASALPMPGLLTDMGRIFVGRDAELERLVQFWKEVAAGERRVVLLAGEPGVGKTRLAAELAVAAHAEGAVVLAGRCDEDLGVPYQPFVEALRHFIDHIPVEESSGRLGRYGGELVRLVPELAERLPALPPVLQSDPETEQYRLFDAVAAWLAALAEDAAVLMVLDDLQWAAKPTLLLLRHIVQSPDTKRLLVLGTYRDTDLGHGHPLVDVVADLRRQGALERLSLVGLDSIGVAAFIERATGHELDEGDLRLAQAIHEETEGNPFFVREVVRHLTETGALERRTGRWPARLPVEEVGIPESVRDVVGRRLARLSPEAVQTLRVAAVVGPQFELAVLEEAANLDEESLLASLEEAASARLVIEAFAAGRPYRFAHVLVRDTLYEELSAARRAALHRRVAQAIEVIHGARLDDHLPALAHHWARASVPAADAARAVEYAWRAGDRAMAQLAHDEAAAYYTQALELLDAAGPSSDEGRRVDLLTDLGEALRRAGNDRYRQTLFDAARMAQERGDADALARAALANCRGGIFAAIGSLDAERVAVLETALAAVGPEKSPRRARLLANLALELVPIADRSRRVSLADEALDLARSFGDLRTLGHVLLARVYAIHTPDTLAERLSITAELVSLAEQSRDPVISLLAAWLRVRCVLEVGDTDEADRHLEMMEDLVDELGQPALRWNVSWTRVGRLISAGRLLEADRLSRDGLEVGLATGQSDAPLLFTVQQFQILFDTGRLEDLEKDLVDLCVRMPGFGLLQLLRAVLYLETSRVDDARAIFAPLAATNFAAVPSDYTWTRSMGLCAHLAAHFGDRGSARVVHDLLLPYRDQIVVTGGMFAGAVVHHLAILATTVGELGQADDHFRAAEIAHVRIAAPTWLARTRLEWARLLLMRRQPGDAERAQELLRQALDTAQELGLGGVERQAVALMGEL